MKVLKAFETLGLKPPLEFLWSTPEGSTIRLGATTHMLVTAAAEVIKGNDVLIVGHNMGYSEQLGRECSRHVNKLLAGGIIRKVDRSFHFGTGFGAVYYESTRTRVKFLSMRNPQPLEFQDHVWAQDAVRARKGIYEAIREIRLENGHYNTYSAAGEPVGVELTEEGAEALVEADPFRVRLIR